MGKQVPYKMLGYNSSYDLVTNIPDVVQVTQLNGGETLLLAVPDKTTEHIAKMIGNQRANRDGFNYILSH
jgi:tudor domain-containing protein 5